MFLLNIFRYRTVIAPSCISNMKYFPSVCATVQVKGIHPAMTEFVTEVKGV